MGVALKLAPLQFVRRPSSLESDFPKVTILADRDDRDAEVRREKRPSGGPSVALLETTNGQNGLLAVSPAHAGAFQPLWGERLARRFDTPLPMGSPRA